MQDENNVCVVCKENTVKYKCPKCLKRTCCLDCIKLHKINDKCDGIRNRTCFVPKPNYTESSFTNDYYFLQDIQRAVENANRENKDIMEKKNRRKERQKRKKKSSLSQSMIKEIK